MHELSLVASIVDAVTETAAAYPGATVAAVHLRLGALSDVIEDSLQFCWDLTIEGTPLAGAKLLIKTIPVVVYCSHCDSEVQLESLQHFRCPRCGQPAADLRQGKELEIESIEIDEKDEDCVQQPSA